MVHQAGDTPWQAGDSLWQPGDPHGSRGDSTTHGPDMAPRRVDASAVQRAHPPPPMKLRPPTRLDITITGTASLIPSDTRHTTGLDNPTR